MTERPDAFGVDHDPPAPARATLLQRSFLPASLAIVLAAFLLVPLPWVATSAPRVLAVEELLVVDDALADRGTDGDWLVATYDVRQSSAADLLRGLLDADVRVRRGGEVLPPGEDDRRYADRQRFLTRMAANLGGALALAESGLDVDPRRREGDGVIVRETLADTPAAGAVQVDDVILGFDASRSARRRTSCAPSSPTASDTPAAGSRSSCASDATGRCGPYACASRRSTVPCHNSGC